MKKFITLGTLFTGLFFLDTSPVFANNLLTNANFENGINNWDVAGPNWDAQSAVVYSGTISAKNTIGTIPGQDYFASFSQTKPLSPGQAIYATLRAKSNIDVRSSAVVGLLVEFLNGSDVLISKTQSQIGGLTDWRQLYVSATAPAGTAKIKFHAFVFAAQADLAAINGVVYFDEAILTADPISAPPQATTISNTGFENGLNDWNLIYSPAFLVDNQGAQTGSYSAKNTVGTIAGQDFFSSASQDLQYLGGPIYASVYIKTNLNPASTAVAGFLLEFYNQFNPAPGSRIGFSQQTKVGVNDWTRVLVNGVTAPAGTVMVRVHIFTFAVKNDAASIGGTANFDNIVFSYQPLPPENFKTSILNNGFENGLNNWSELFGFPAQVSTTVHTGNYSAQKTIGQIEGQDYYSQIYQDVYYNAGGSNFPAGTPVYATAYVQTSMNPVTKSKAGLQLQFINNQGQVIQDAGGHDIVISSAVGGQTPWRYLYVTGTTPIGTKRVRVSGFEFARKQDSALAGNVYFDDFQFSLVPLLLPPVKINLINSNFENGLNDWQELNSPGEVSTQIKYAGNYAAVYQSNSIVTLQDYYGSASQDIYVSPSKNVYANVWVKTDIDPLASASQAGISLIFLDADGQQIGAELTNTIGGQQNWTSLSVSKITPAGTQKVRVTCFLFSSLADLPLPAKAYFDNAYYVAVSSGGGGGGPRRFPAEAIAIY